MYLHQFCLIVYALFSGILSRPVISSESDNIDTSYTADIPTTRISSTINSQFIEENGVIRRREDVKSTFRVERLDSPIERIEIKLIDENETNSQQRRPYREKISQKVDETIDAGGENSEETTSNHSPTHSFDENMNTNYNRGVGNQPTITTVSAVYQEKYKKVEYVSEAMNEETSTHSLLDERESTQQQERSRQSEPLESTGRREIEGDRHNNLIQGEPEIIDDQSFTLPLSTLPPPSSELEVLTSDVDTLPILKQTTPDEDEEALPVEECLENRNLLSKEQVDKLMEQANRLGKLIRKLNRQQSSLCQGGKEEDKLSYRQCPIWREEKMVHYYKLMRITYCANIEKWPNSPRFKRTYAAHLPLFETLYAFNQ